MIKKTQRWALRLTLLMAVTTGVAMIPKTAAALPTGCYAAKDSASYAHAYCSGGTGAFRVVAGCYSGGLGYTVYGPWASPGEFSYVSCPGGTIDSPRVQKVYF